MAALGHPDDTPLWRRITAVTGEAGYAHDDRLGPEARLRAVRGRPGNKAVAARTEAAAMFGAAGLPRDALVCRVRALAWASVPGTGSGEGRNGDAPEPRNTAAGDSAGPAAADSGSDAGAGASDRAAVRAGLDVVLREAVELAAASGGSQDLAAPSDRSAVSADREADRPE
ncbi:hypothetical protein ACFV7Q_21450 [Streptomyces sp. NPDC059851]|uniref:hypothetical protein n=1 Tax=Streptomyces sp. NPDC059851 TaxID=3346971 RepID=UPI0036689A27